MKKINYIILLSVLSFISIALSAQNNFSVPRYDIKSFGTGTEGIYSAEVFVYLPKPNKNVDENIRKAAIHGLIFKGLTAGTGGTSQRALVKESADAEHIDFFSSFFNDVNVLNRYVNVVDGTLRAEKIEKKLYRIRAVVTLKKDDLRSYLEKNNIVESFNDLF